jgi:hypothetical protein
MKEDGGVDVLIHIFLTLALAGGESSALGPCRVTPPPPGEYPPVAIGLEVGWTQSRYGRRGKRKILDPTGTRTPTPQSSSP